MMTLPLNSSWKFRKLPGLTLDHLPDMLAEGSREELSLPHTWYSDEDPYLRLAVYEKTVGRKAEWKKAFLSFDAADQSCRVFVNGHFAGGHRGGYSRFRLPVPEAERLSPPQRRQQARNPRRISQSRSGVSQSVNDYPP